MNATVNTEVKSPIELSKVSSVYSGKPGCCCGCRGKHSYATAHREWAGKNRGYAVDDEDLDDAGVKRVVNKLNKQLGLVEFEDGYAFLETETRLYIAYFVEGI